MNLNRITSHFETEAFEYDGLIPKLIPGYQEQHQIILKLIPFQAEQGLEVLDLGCGTGVLAYLVLNSFPKAKVTAFDLADNMLKVCAENLALFKERLTLRQGNFGTADLGKGYDLIVSGLSIHHLADPDKRILYKRIFEALNPGGIFINREIILGATPKITEQYHLFWQQFIKSNGEDEEKWFNNYLNEDTPASLEDQLGWLREAGFIEVGGHWQYFNFAIFSGSKPDK